MDRPPTNRLRRRRGRPADLSADEEGGQDEGDRRQQLDEDVERGAGRVLEGVADRVADDGGRMGRGLLADRVALVVEQVARFDVLLGVVPGSTAVVEDG